METDRNNSTNEQLLEIIIYIIAISSAIFFVVSSENMYNYNMHSIALRIMAFSLIAVEIIVFIRMKSIRIGIILMMILFGFISYLIHPGNSFYDFIISITGYIAFPICLEITTQTKYKVKIKYIIRITAIIYSLIFLYLGYIAPKYDVMGALTLGYFNSNTTGFYLLATFCLLIISGNSKKSFLSSVFNWVIAGLLLNLLMLTKCRTAFIISIIMIIVYFLPKLPAVNANSKFFLYFELFVLTFSVIYVVLYNSGLINELIYLTKTIFSGRQRFYVNTDITIFGNYGNNTFGGLNFGIGIINSLGVVGLILYCMYLFSYNKHSYFISNSVNNGKDHISFYFFLLMLLTGCTETYFLLGGIYVCLMYLIMVVVNINTQLLVSGEENRSRIKIKIGNLM